MSEFSGVDYKSLSAVRQSVIDFCEAVDLPMPVPELSVDSRRLSPDFGVLEDVAPTLPHLLGAIKEYEAGNFTPTNRQFGISEHGIDWLNLQKTNLEDPRVLVISALMVRLYNQDKIEGMYRFDEHAPTSRVRLYEISPGLHWRFWEGIGFTRTVTGTSIGISKLDSDFWKRFSETSK